MSCVALIDLRVFIDCGRYTGQWTLTFLSGKVWQRNSSFTRTRRHRSTSERLLSRSNQDRMLYASIGTVAGTFHRLIYSRSWPRPGWVSSIAGVQVLPQQDFVECLQGNFQIREVLLLYLVPEPEFSNFVASLPIHSRGSSLKSFYLEFGVSILVWCLSDNVSALSPPVFVLMHVPRNFPGTVVKLWNLGSNLEVQFILPIWQQAHGCHRCRTTPALDCSFR